MSEIFTLYRGKVTLEQDRWHRYFMTCPSKGLDRVRVDGVTTPLNRIAKEFLISWAAKMSVRDLGYYDREKWDEEHRRYEPIPEEKLVEHHQRLIEIHSKVKLTNVEQFYALLKDAKGAHRREKAGAADLGTLGHAWVEGYIKWRVNQHAITVDKIPFAKRPFPGFDEMPEIPAFPQLQNAANSFLKWESEHRVVFLNSEKRVASVKHLFAGTMDFDAVIDDELSMGDLKTSNQIATEYRFQTAAYQAARQEEFPRMKYQSRTIVRVGKDLVENDRGEKVLEVEAKRFGNETFDRDFRIFLDTLALHRGLNEVEAEEKQEKENHVNTTKTNEARPDRLPAAPAGQSQGS